MTSKNSAQGTIEYLVIIAIVVVVSLVVVSLILNLSSPSEQISSSAQNITAISSQISFFEVVSDNNGNLLIDLRNNSDSGQTLKKISLLAQNGEELSSNTYDFTGFTQGSKYIFSYSGEGCECESGQSKKSCKIKVTSINEYGFEKTYVADVSVSCTTLLDTTSNSSYIHPDANSLSDTTPPMVWLLSPSAGQTIETIDFIFRAHDDRNLASCSFVVGGQTLQTLTQPVMDTNIIFRLPNGTTTGGPSNPDNNNWTVSCTDGINTATPAQQTFTNKYSTINYVSACGTLSTQYSYKHLTQDVNTYYGSCFPITDNNLTIGGAGHSVFSENPYGASEAFDGYNAGSPGYTGIILLDLTITNFNDAGINVSGGTVGGIGANGGTILIKRCSITAYAKSDGGSSQSTAGNGGKITIIDSNVILAQAIGGMGMSSSNTGVVQSGRGGDINAVNSKVDVIWNYGFSASCQSGCVSPSGIFGGNSGNVFLTNSSASEVRAYGGNASCLGGSCGLSTGGNGGAVTFNPCPSAVPSVNVNAGSPSGTIGTITPSGCHS